MWSVRRAARLRSREALAWAAVKAGRSVLRVAALATWARRCLRAGELLEDGTGVCCGLALMMVNCFGGAYAVFCGDGDLASMALEEFPEATLGFAVAVHWGDVEVADAGVVGGLEELERVAAVRSPP